MPSEQEIESFDKRPNRRQKILRRRKIVAKQCTRRCHDLDSARSLSINTTAPRGPSAETRRHHTASRGPSIVTSRHTASRVPSPVVNDSVAIAGICVLSCVYSRLCDYYPHLGLVCSQGGVAIFFVHNTCNFTDEDNNIPKK